MPSKFLCDGRWVNHVEIELSCDKNAEEYFKCKFQFMIKVTLINQVEFLSINEVPTVPSELWQNSRSHFQETLF